MRGRGLGRDKHRCGMRKGKGPDQKTRAVARDQRYLYEPTPHEKWGGKDPRRKKGDARGE